MVVGYGLLAKAFKQYENNNKVLIFASGVSNSSETNAAAYARERELLAEFATVDKKLIYFSTTSIYDQSLQSSNYIKHKLDVESYIASTFPNYIIFRLPNVVGVTKNNNTFFNNIKSKLINGQEIRVNKHAYRYIVDIDDLVATLPSVIDCENRITINACYNNKTSVRDLVKLMGTILHKEYNEILVDGGGNYTVDNSKFLSYVSKESVALSQDYDYIVLNKYLNDNILLT